MKDTEMNVPDGWQTKALGDILRYEQPYRYSVISTDYDDKSGIPVLTAGKSFILGYTTETEGIYNNLPVIIFDDFTTDSKYVDFPFKVKSSAMKFLIPKDAALTDLKLVFGHIQRLKIRETGGDHKRRWISDFSKLKIHLPPPVEQRQIARILSKVDEAIGQIEQLLAKYRRLKTGLMQDLLTKGIDEHGNIRSEDTHAFKDSPLGRIPVEWTQCVLGTAITLQRGFDITSKSSVDGLIPIISSSGITGYHNQAMVKGPGVITGRKGTLGKVFFIGKDFWPHDTTLWVKDFKGNDPFFISLILEKLELKRFDVATANPTLNRNFIHPLPIIIPSSPSEQKRIAKNIILANKPIEQFKKDLAKLHSLKNGLMQDLLSGKVPVRQLIRKTADI